MVVCIGKCKTCGTEFKKYRRFAGEAKYCSNACRIITKNHGISNCETCGKEFNWYRSDKKKTPKVCSHKCQGNLVKEWRSKHGFTWKNLTEEQLQYQLRVCFDERIQKTETCWLWTGSKNLAGYGVFHAGGKTNALAAHRLSWTVHKGKIPDGLVVRHQCNNPGCVNPDHLLLGTLQDNSDDRVKAGNSCAGSKNFKACLDEYKVKEIKKLLDDGLSGAEIGRRFGVTRTTVNAIKKNRTWKHVIFRQT